MLSPVRSHPLPRSLQWLIAAILALAVLAGILQKSSRAQTGESDFTVIALPDTQNEAEKFPQVLNAQTKWIADNRDALNIQMVMAEGDNINDGTSTAQMQNLDAAFRLLDNAGVPYLLGIGNHDYNAFDPRSRNLSGFDQWFGPGRYSGKAYFRGNFPSGSNANTYGVLTINGKQYLFLTFEFRPRSSSLDWAESILSANPDKEAIIVDHSFVLKNGKREDLCDDQDMPAGNATGQEVWTRLRKYKVILVLSGHFTGGPAARRADLSDTGSLVNQLFADYQDFSNGGNGWLRIMTFHPASNSISVKTYSPFLNQSMTDGANQFTLAYHNPFPNSGQGSISGKVRNQSGCAAVAGIHVSAGAVSTTSAADGTYSLSVAPGSYTVTASGSGWNTSSKDEKVSDSLDTQVNFYLTSGTSPTPTPTPPPSGCTAGPASPSVTICSPLNNATVTSPVRVVAATRDSVPVSFMQIYVDGSSVLTSSGGTLDKTVAMAAGTRRLTVQAKDTAGVIFKQTIYINVSSSPGPTPTPTPGATPTPTPTPGATPTPTQPPSGCTAGPASPSVTICSPLNNATVTSPVRVVAATRDSVPVSFMQIYVDGSPVLTSSGGTLDKTITLAAGTRRLTVQAKDTAGVIFKQTISITVR
jgi:hypothetical protein